jgi:hypothetical protein
MTAPEDPATADYVRRVLDAYRRTPGTTGQVRAADRRLALDLNARGVSLGTVQDALLVASARRFCRATPTSLPSPARSLAYFVPTVDELLREPIADGHRRYLADRLQRALASLT